MQNKEYNTNRWKKKKLIKNLTKFQNKVLVGKVLPPSLKKKLLLDLTKCNLGYRYNNFDPS